MTTERRAKAGPSRDEKTGKWGFVVDVGVDGAGKRRQARRRGFRTRKEAQAEYDRLKHAVNTSAYVAPVRQTVGEYLAEWFPAIEHTIEPSTLSSYRQNVRLHVVPHIGGVQLQRLDAGALNRLYGELRAKGLSTRTIRYVHVILHRALKDAVKWDRIVRNPADASDPPRQRDAAAPEMKTWDAPTLARFLELAEGNRYRSAWLTLATTGMRRGECLGLRWRDVDLDSARLSIVQTVTIVDHKIRIAGRTKTGKGRAVDLDATTVAELRAHRARQARELLLLGMRPDGDTLVFSHPDGRAHNPNVFSREFQRFAERHPELPRIRVHDLRHTHATIALAIGVPTKIVAERLGHSSTRITDDRYSHVTPTMGAAAAQRIADGIFGGEAR
jgi:integrase